MFFLGNPHLRKLEAFMQQIPHFPPKSAKAVFDMSDDENLLLEAENLIFNFKLPERKEKIMKFRNDSHRNTFLNEVKKHDIENHKMIAVLYLLTADVKLWNIAKGAVLEDEINFENIRLKNGSENAYALYCAAEDLYSGSRKLAIDDVADNELIGNNVFDLICNAMVIKRKGLAAVITINGDCTDDCDEIL